MAYQIAAAARVVLCTTKIGDGTVSYRVEEVWKAPPSAPSLRTGEALRLDTRTHKLLGYRHARDQKVVLLFVDSGLPTNQPLELVPVVDGAITYAPPHDASVQEKITLQQLRERVAGLAIPSFTFSCKLQEKRDLTKVLQLLPRKGVPLGERTKRLGRSP